MFYYVYVLRSLKNNSLYIGFTSNLRRRFEIHNKGNNKSTKPFLPYVIIYYEGFLNKEDAMSREVYLKSGYGRRTINKLLKSYLIECLNHAELSK